MPSALQIFKVHYIAKKNACLLIVNLILVTRGTVWFGFVEKMFMFARQNPENLFLFSFFFSVKMTVIPRCIHLRTMEEVLHVLPGH